MIKLPLWGGPLDSGSKAIFQPLSGKDLNARTSRFEITKSDKIHRFNLPVQLSLKDASAINFNLHV